MCERVCVCVCVCVHTSIYAYLSCLCNGSTVYSKGLLMCCPSHPTQQRYPQQVLLQSAARGTVHSLTRCPHHNHLIGKPSQTPPPTKTSTNPPLSSSPIYEAIPEQLTLQASGGGKGQVDPHRTSLSYDKVEQPPKLYARPCQPQPPVPPGYK